LRSADTAAILFSRPVAGGSANGFAEIPLSNVRRTAGGGMTLISRRNSHEPVAVLPHELQPLPRLWLLTSKPPSFRIVDCLNNKEVERVGAAVAFKQDMVAHAATLYAVADAVRHVGCVWPWRRVSWSGLVAGGLRVCERRLISRRLHLTGGETPSTLYDYFAQVASW
jgi:hypothetical protein